MPDEIPLSAPAIAVLHDRATEAWHHNADASALADSELMTTILAQHRANFDLWHTEDRARAPRATDSEIVEVKRDIDRYNQLRNDLSETCDTMLLGWFQERESLNPAAELHSESPGLMIDRLSILALKIYHTQEETLRPGAPAGHGQRNRERLSLLTEQRDDLVGCLDRLIEEVIAGRRRFKLYRQLKMYNDPALNPAIYGSQ